jgi:SAM-dependent methyltransferase
LARKGYEVTGIDVEEIEYEKGVTFFQEDFSQRTSLPPESFDAVVATGTLLGVNVGHHNVAERISYFRRIHTQVEKVLRPGGLYILTLPVSQGSFRQVLFEAVMGRDLPRDVPPPRECNRLWSPYLNGLKPGESLRVFGRDRLSKDYTEIGYVLWKKVKVPLSRIAGREDPYVCGGYKQSIDSLTRFYKRLGKRLNKPCGRILDVGCGDGKVSQALSQAGYQVSGVDRSAIGIALARNRVKEGRFLAADLLIDRNLLVAEGFSNFDVILARQFSLFSVPDLSDNHGAFRTIQQLLELLKEAGVIIVQHASNLVDSKSKDGTFYYHFPKQVRGLVERIPGCKLVDLFHVVPDENSRVFDSTQIDADCQTPCLIWIVSKDGHDEKTEANGRALKP